MKFQKWSKDEIEFLKQSFETKSWYDILTVLDRTQDAIRTMARVLKLRRKRVVNENELWFRKLNKVVRERKKRRTEGIRRMLEYDRILQLWKTK